MLRSVRRWLEFEWLSEVETLLGGSRWNHLEDSKHRLPHVAHQGQLCSVLPQATLCRPLPGRRADLAYRGASGQRAAANRRVEPGRNLPEFGHQPPDPQSRQRRGVLRSAEGDAQRRRGGESAAAALYRRVGGVAESAI